MAGPQVAAGREDRRPAPAVDRSVHPPAAQQRGVGGVHDRVHLLLGDVALHCHDVHVTSLPHAEPVFETERLAIRDWQPEDVDRMLDMYSRADVVRFLGSVPTPMTVARDWPTSGCSGHCAATARQRAAGSPYGWWAVTARAGGVVVGTVALVQVDGGQGLDGPVEVAWALHPDSSGPRLRHRGRPRRAGPRARRRPGRGAGAHRRAQHGLPGGLPAARPRAAGGVRAVLRQAAARLVQASASTSRTRSRRNPLPLLSTLTTSIRPIWRGRRDVGAAVGLGVQADDVDDAHDLELGRQQVGRGADQVRVGRERLVARQAADLDGPVGRDLGVRRPRRPGP